MISNKPKISLGSPRLYWYGRYGWVDGWVAGKCETITNSASAEAAVEALAELGNTEK